MNLIITRADENISSMTELTHPVIKEYAKKVNADFQILNKPSPCVYGLDPHHYRIFECRELLEEYDRILSLDSDMIILPNCPNLFDTVSEQCIGSIYEDVGSRLNARRALIKQVQELWGGVSWISGYINTGCFIVSKQHREIFTTFNNKFWDKAGVDDIHLGYNIHKLEYNIHELPFKYNHMTMFSESWNNNSNRFDSHIIHYAGNGIFEPDKYNTRLEQMKADYNLIYEN